MLFNFKLKQPLECAGLENDEIRDNYISWFYLTDSEYFIDLGEVKLFQLSSQWAEKYNSEYQSGVEFVEYQYTRQLEDLFEILPTITCPIPSDLYNLIETNEKRDLLYNKILYVWENECTDDEQWNDIDDRYDNVIRNLIYYGSLDSGYLRFKAECQFLHTDGLITILYDFIDEDENNYPVWSAGKGTYTLTYREFISEIENLLNLFFNAMDKQIENAIKSFDIQSLKKSNLISENSRRKDYFYKILNSIKDNTFEKQIDWQKLRDDLNYILDRTRL